MYDVIVVGAGPSGCTAARLLAESNHSVLLMDENLGRRENIVCTGIVGTEAFDAMAVPREAVVDTITNASFISPSGIKVAYRPVDPMAYVVNRTHFDSCLQREASRSGVEFLKGHAARGLDFRPREVRVIAKGDGEERVTLDARAVIVATGHQRWLHTDAGVGVPSQYLHGVHADLPFHDLEQAELYFGNEVAPGFFAWAVPFGDGLARLGILSKDRGTRRFRDFLDHPWIRNRLDARVDDKLINAALMSRAIVQGPVSPSFSDRVLLVGESAGQVKTTTAGGIYYGMIGAELASEVLDKALRRNELMSDSLQRYEDVWHARLRPEIEAGLHLQKAARSLEDDQIDRLFSALEKGFAAVIQEVVHFDWHLPVLGMLFRRWKPLVAGQR